MDPTNIQDDLMHELIRGDTKFYEAENDGTQFLNLHYHGDKDEETNGEEEENLDEAEV